MKKIRVIAPVTLSTGNEDIIQRYAATTHPGFIIEGVYLDEGPATIESAYEEALAAPRVLQKSLEAERDGMDAVIIDCMNDPGLEAAREIVSIPVIGAGQASMLLAALLSHRFSIIGTAARDVRPFERLVKRYGVEELYASTRWVDISVADLNKNSDFLAKQTAKEAEKAVEHDNAHAVVLGCTLMASVANQVRNLLKEQGIDIPVINPSEAALKWTETIVSLELKQSSLSYPAHSIPPSFFQADIETSTGKIFSPEQPSEERRPIDRSFTLIVPVVADGHSQDWLKPSEIGYCDPADSTVDIQVIQRGPISITSVLGDTLATPEILRLAVEAEESGSSAVLLDCMGDPGFESAREAVTIPVLCPLHTAIFLISSLAKKFTVLTSEQSSIGLMTNLIGEYGLKNRLASVRCLNLTPIEIENDRKKTLQAAIEQALAAVKNDGAHAIIPGCTAMVGLASAITTALKKQGIDIPVIDPPAAIVRLAEGLTDLGLSHSKRSWPLPK